MKIVYFFSFKDCNQVSDTFLSKKSKNTDGSECGFFKSAPSSELPVLRN